MKRTLPILLAIVMLMGVLGCKKKTEPVTEPQIQGTLESIFEDIYEGADLELPSLGNTALTDENKAYYLGTDEVEITEGMASEAMISAIPFSVVLVRLPEGADIAAAKKLILDNANPNKWICVSVDPSDVVVDNLGNLVILIMADGSQQLHKSFLALAD